jgi:hypothetical protein
MRYVLCLLLTLSWALWLGGQATLVLLIVTLFRTDRDTAVRAGPILFHAFERYQLFCAAVATVSAIALFIISRRKILLAMIAAFLLAATGGIISITAVTPRMEQIWRDGKSDSPNFQILHRYSSTLYRAEMLLLLAAGCALPAALLPPLVQPSHTREHDPDDNGAHERP